MSTREDLEQRLDDRPEDQELLQVYADVLSESGDPLGELIQLQCAVLAAPEDPDLLSRLRGLRRRLVPSLLLLASTDWRGAFVRSARFTVSEGFDFSSLRSALEAIHGRFVRRLHLEIHATSPKFSRRFTEFLRAATRLRELRLDHLPDYWSIPSAVVQARRIQLLAGLPAHLEGLELGAAGRVADWIEPLADAAALPTLKSLRIVHGLLEPTDVGTLTARLHRLNPRCQIGLRGVSASLLIVRALERRWRVGSVDCGEGPWLLVLGPAEDAGRVIPLGGSRAACRIGHLDGCELQLRDAGLMPVHATVTIRPTFTLIRPDGPLGTTLVDEKLVPDDGVELRHGSQIQVGSAVLTFLDSGVEAERSALLTRVRAG